MVPTDAHDEHAGRHEVIDPERILDDLLPAIVLEDADAVVAFLEQHATTRGSVAQLFHTLPLWAAAALKAHPNAPTPAPDEVWTFELLRPDDQTRTISAQMLVAALNDDSAHLRDLVSAVMGWPDEAHERVMVKLIVDLIAVFRSFATR